MNKGKKLLALIAALALVFALSVPVFAADVVKVHAGDEETVSFDFPNVYGVNGYFTVTFESNEDMFDSAVFEGYHAPVGETLPATPTDEITDDLRAYIFANELINASITYKVKVAASAQAGDKAIVTFTGETSDTNGEVENISKTIEIVIEAPATGDHNALGIWAIISLVAAMGAGAAIFLRKRA